MTMATFLTAGVAGIALVAVVVLCWQLRRQQRVHQASLNAILESNRAETETLRRRLDDLAAEAASRRASAGGLLITDIDEPATLVPDRVVVSATVGGPLIKLAAALHGLGQALSAPSRNRIRFEMRRELRRARKQRRREMRAAWRERRSASSQVEEGDAA